MTPMGKRPRKLVPVLPPLPSEADMRGILEKEGRLSREVERLRRQLRCAKRLLTLGGKANPVPQFRDLYYQALKEWREALKEGEGGGDEH